MLRFTTSTPAEPGPPGSLWGDSMTASRESSSMRSENALLPAPQQLLHTTALLIRS